MAHHHHQQQQQEQQQQRFCPPPATRDTFKDLLVFEERLKQNAERLQRQRIKYEAFLVTIIAASLLLAYKTFIAISPYKLIHYLYVALFLVSITTLILFFATGMYTDQIAYAYKFIPQTNRALRPFNMFLMTPSTATSSMTRSSSSGSGSGGSGWSMGGRLALVPRPIKQLFGPSPASSLAAPSPHPPKEDSLNPQNINPRGEILFSSAVNPAFIDQYKLYRHQWEIRQKKS